EIDFSYHPVQYKDFAVWHNRQLAGPGGKKSLHYWKKTLADGVPVLRLPVDYETGKDDKAGAGWRAIITADLKVQLKKLAESNKMTLFTIMFSIYGYVLSHISGQKEVACSVITAGRDHPSLHHIIGFFVNSIILNVRVDGQKPFEAFLNELNDKVIEAFQHQMYPLELVFEELEMRYPEISASFNVINIGDVSAISIEQDELSHIANAQDVKFDLEVYVREYANGLEMYWAYKKNMFDPGTIEHMVKLYMKLMEFFCANPGRNPEEYFYERNKQKSGKFQKKR
ncbi:MAG TPA: condensation domain-containing protein, partial [Candidatus Deferrimicrobium sp.]|nr:condensation domain-containing protein [Candidatus Deferrimicrobium sp.]